MGRSGFVAIIGRPNVGKSTLLNSILGTSVSIVTPKAQTTRERVLGILTEKRGKKGADQIVFIDTPGIHRAKEGGINAYMMSEAREALEEPSVIWYLVDPASALKHEQAVFELLKDRKAPVFLLMNKIDVLGKALREKTRLFAEELAAALREQGCDIAYIAPISAEKGKGVEELLDETWKRLPEGPLFYPDEEQVSDRPMRFFAAEKIREQLLRQLGEELPYCCAVEVQNYTEPKAKGEVTRIEAIIHVERDSQKGMVIGKGGQKIKEIGQAAREAIEDFIGAKVFLGLQVDVLKDWSKDAEALKRMGYDIPSDKKGGRRGRPSDKRSAL